ncbi:MAG: spore photoproduct lyase family protein [Leptospirales bacterium]
MRPLEAELSTQVPIETVFVDRTVSKTPFTLRLFENLKKYPGYNNVAWVEIEDYKTFIEENSDKYSFERGKKNLILYPEKGEFLHACPGSDGVLCCHYYVLDFGMNCPYDCHYCFLQTYLTSPFYKMAANTDELFLQLKNKLTQNTTGNRNKLRIGTGEYTDSLAADHITGLSSDFIHFFRDIPNTTLELKTKSTNIENLLNVDPQGSVVVSWSVNPGSVIEETEIGCPTLEQRLEAAKKIIQAGYQVAFHFDPIIAIAGWESEYKEVIDTIFDTIDPDKIRWISLGTFRYSPGLKEKLRERYPNETITRKEMFAGKDGKLRYFFPDRVQIYKTLQEHIRKRSADMFVYLCMEVRSAWQPVFHYTPSGPLTLDEQFEKRRVALSGK